MTDGDVIERKVREELARTLNTCASNEPMTGTILCAGCGDPDAERPLYAYGPNRVILCSGCNGVEVHPDL